MKGLKAFFLSLVLLSSLFIAAPKAQAADFCTGLYGGGSSCVRISIDKKVQKPGTKDYVDNLSIYDPKYNPNDYVNFQIVITNTGDKTINNLQVSDTLPQYVSFVSGPGSYDPNTNKMTFTIGSLNTGESQTYYVQTRVVANPSFANANMCVSNYVLATESNGASADDSAQFCIAKVYPLPPVTKAPPTGPEAIAIPMLFGMGGLGWILRKKSK